MTHNRSLADIIIHIFLALALIVAVPIGTCFLIGFSLADAIARQCKPEPRRTTHG